MVKVTTRVIFEIQLGQRCLFFKCSDFFSLVLFFDFKNCTWRLSSIFIELCETFQIFLKDLKIKIRLFPLHNYFLRQSSSLYLSTLTREWSNSSLILLLWCCVNEKNPHTASLGCQKSFAPTDI